LRGKGAYSSSIRNGAPFQEALRPTLTAGLQRARRRYGVRRSSPVGRLLRKSVNRILPSL
jgi:hypothetical protein